MIINQTVVKILQIFHVMLIFGMWTVVLCWECKCLHVVACRYWNLWHKSCDVRMKLTLIFATYQFSCCETVLVVLYCTHACGSWCVHASLHLNVITNQKWVYFEEIYLKNGNSWEFILNWLSPYSWPSDAEHWILLFWVNK